MKNLEERLFFGSGLWESIMKNALSLRLKIVVSILAIIIVSNLFLVLFLYGKSKSELVSSILKSSGQSAHSTALEIGSINDMEYKMLSSLAGLPVIRDDNVDLKEKWNIINAVVKGNDSYIGMAIYDEYGVGWTTTGKYQDLYTRGYLQIALKGKPSILDPAWSPVNGKLSTFYALPVYDYSEKQIGVVVAVIDSLKLCSTVSDVVIGKQSHPYVINRTTGKYVAHSDITFLKEGKGLYDDLPPEMESVVEGIKAGNSSSLFCRDNATGKEFCVSYEPVGGNTDWVVVCSAPAEDFLAEIVHLRNLAVLFVIIFTVISVLIVSSIVMKSLRPVGVLKDSIRTIASGHADLTRRIDISSNDEIGEVVSGFNEFTAKLQDIVSGVKEAKEELLVSDASLQEKTDAANSSISHIISNLDAVNGEISNQAECVDNTVESVRQIAGTISSLDSLVQIQASGTENASAAVEQMVGNIQSVNNSVERMSELFNRLLEDAQTGSGKQSDVSSQITDIAKQSEMLQEANAVIASIAEQTNLLAMNAAIEAAHAGDAGKGFSVVADEIRKLSETSSSQSKNIGEQLKLIKDSIQNVVVASDESNVSFTSVVQDIKETNRLMQEIKNAMAEQQVGSSQISEAVIAMKESAGKVREESVRMSGQNKSVLDGVQRLKDVTGVMNGKISDMENEIEAVSGSGKDLAEIASVMSSSIQNIGNRIDEFKV